MGFLAKNKNEILTNNQTMKHTNGNWKVVASGGKVISETKNDHYVNICTLADYPLSISEEIEANAKLIAAAPTLLNTLATVRDYLKQTATDNPIDDKKWLAGLIEEAIKKVTG